MKIPVSIAVLVSILSATSCSQNEIANIPDNDALINVSSDSGISDTETPVFNMVSIEEAERILKQWTIHCEPDSSVTQVPYEDYELAALPLEKQREIKLNRIFYQYTTLTGYTYQFDMPKDVADEFSITDAEYQSFTDRINRQNEFTKRAIASGIISVVKDRQTGRYYKFYIKKEKDNTSSLYPSNKTSRANKPQPTSGHLSSVDGSMDFCKKFH